MDYKILNDLISINTIEDKNIDLFKEYIKSILKPLNFDFLEYGNDKKILVAKRGNNINVGFICHMDTVKYKNNWQYNPFELTINDNNLYGLGVCDMKGGIAALIESILELPIDMPCVIYFTYDEEINFLGIKTLISNVFDFPKNIIITEPTNLIPVVANKGCLEFKVSIKGISAHSSTPDKGVNAILKGINYINELNEYATSLKNIKNDIFDINYTTFNVSKINGGNLMNQVPDNTDIYFSFRTIDKKQQDDIVNFVKDLTNEYNGVLEIINNVPCVINESKDFIKKVESIIGTSAIGENYTTEGSFINNSNILILGPGPVTAHEDNEHISIESYKKTKDIYKKIIEYFS